MGIKTINYWFDEQNHRKKKESTGARTENPIDIRADTDVESDIEYFDEISIVLGIKGK